MSLNDDSFADAPTSAELAKYDLNDYGNGLRLIRLMGGVIRKDSVRPDIRHCRLLSLVGQGWIAFNGQHWDIKLGEQLAKQAAHMVAQKMRNADVAAAVIEHHGIDHGTLRKYQDGLGQSGATVAMLRQAEPYLSVEIDDFDADPMAVNCRNGTLFLRDDPEGLRVTLRPHSPADRITRMVHTDYDKAAKAPVFLKTLETSLRDVAVRAFFQRAAGYSLTGHIYEQAFFALQGRGRDGKSTIMNAVREVMGSYGASAKVETFLDSGQANPNGPQPELVRLAGETRLALLAEPPRGAKLNESLIKGWTGGDPYSARQLQSKNFEFIPKARLWLMCNALPVIKGDDDGIWRRTNVILFEHQVAAGTEDKRLPQKLLAEGSGILNWLIEGIGEWLQQGLNPPERVSEALNNYRKTSSPFGDWLEECCVYGTPADGAVTGAGILYASYKEWAEENGHDRPMSVRAFGDALMQRQILLGKRAADGKKTRTPIRLKTIAEKSADGIPSASASDQGGTPFDDPLSMEAYHAP